LSIRGEPVTVAEPVMRTPLFAANYAVADGGTLAYVSAGAETAAINRTPVWVDRHGRETAIALPPRAYADVRIAPDGERVALGIRDQQNDVWIGDLRRHTLTRLTFDPTVDQQPLWTPDGRQIVWTSQHGSGVPSLYMQAADGTGPAELLFHNGNPLFPTSISPDGAHVLAWENNPTNAQDLIVVDLKRPGVAASATARPLVRTPAAEMDGDISADGRWIVYQSNESGQAEIYVRPFPDVDAGRWQVSTAGGTRPAWAHSGREIFYIDTGGYLTSVPVETSGTTFRPGNPVRLLDARYYAGSTSLGLDVRGYDVTADGQRFLMLKDAALDAAPVATFTMIVSLNTTVPGSTAPRP
jgi:Tol biopolymer transport system component